MTFDEYLHKLQVKFGSQPPGPIGPEARLPATPDVSAWDTVGLQRAMATAQMPAPASQTTGGKAPLAPIEPDPELQRLGGLRDVAEGLGNIDFTPTAALVQNAEGAVTPYRRERQPFIAEGIREEMGRRQSTLPTSIAGRIGLPSGVTMQQVQSIGPLLQEQLRTKREAEADIAERTFRTSERVAGQAFREKESALERTAQAGMAGISQSRLKAQAIQQAANQFESKPNFQKLKNDAMNAVHGLRNIDAMTTTADVLTIFNLAKAAQGGGVLSNQDVGLFMGRQAILDRIVNMASRLGTGLLPDDQREEIRSLLKSYVDNASQALRQDALNHAKSTASIYGIDEKELADQVFLPRAMVPGEIQDQGADVIEVIWPETGEVKTIRREGLQKALGLGYKVKNGTSP